MKSKILLLFSGLFLFSGISWGQLALTRSSFTSVYTPITTGGGATTSSATGDDGTQTLVPIGFTFNYLGTNYTNVDISTNGWISFGAAGANAWQNVNLVTNTTPNLTVAPYWDDLYVVGAGAVLFQLQGTPGSQTFTVQWTNVNSFQNTAPFNIINFQVVLFEGTNVIEFRYGSSSTATPNPNESAAIGLENGTGGPGNYLDAVTGSSRTNNGMLNTSTKWPVLNYRFVPGAPTPLAGGTYNVGIGQTYPTLSEAVADVNHRGVSGAVTLNLVDANYDVTPAGGDNIFPIMLGPVAGTSLANTVIITSSSTSTLTYEGAVAGNCGNQGSTTAISATNEPIFAFVGSQYCAIQNVNFNCSGTGVVDRGVAVYNSSSTLGSQFNAIRNVNVTLSRTNPNSIGIAQQTLTGATSIAGSNSFNAYSNFNISNVFSGMLLSGTAAFPDVTCIIGTTNPTVFNTIGGATANDIGNAATATYGLQLQNQANDTVRNCEVRNVTVTGSVTVDGIYLNGVSGTTSCFNNKVHDIRNTSTAATTRIAGINANVIAIGSHTIRVYNNFVYNLTSAYTGAATATRNIRGIFAQQAGGGATTSVINVDFNNVRIDGSSSPNISNSCFETNSGAGPIMNVRNNVFANFTGAQAGVATHYCWRSPNTTDIGTAGSVSNNNDLYIANATNGFVGQGNATNYATLANWQAGMVTQDAASISIDPLFISPTDLHVSALPLINAGTSLAWVTTDIDNFTRPGTPTIGADEVLGCSSADGGTITPSTYTRCSGQTVVLSSTGYSTAAGTTYQWMVSQTPGGPYVNVSGGSGATTGTYTSGVLSTDTLYYVLQATCFFGPVDLSNEVTVTINPTPTAVASSNSPVCNGQTLNLTGTTDIGTSFAWTGPASFTSSTQNPSVPTVSGLNAGTYTFTTIAGSCTSSVSNTVVAIGGAPIGLTAGATPSVVCAGNSTDLSSGVPAGSTTVLTENFNSGAPTWTRVNNSVGGSNPALAAWTDRPDGYNYDGPIYHSNDNSQFVQSNSDAQGSGANTLTLLTSPAFSTAGLTNVTLDFFHFYRDIGTTADSAMVEASLNGTSWTLVNAFVASAGAEGAFAHPSFVLPGAFNNQPTVYVRFRYKTTGWDWYWSIDNVTVAGTQPAIASYSWTSSPAGFTSSSQNPTGVVPPSTTVYTVTATNTSGCTATASTTVTVNPVLVNLDPINVSCNGAGDGSFAINSVVCGTSPFTYSVNGGPFGAIPTNLTPGTYSVVVRDNNSLDAAPVNVVIVQPNVVATPLSSSSDTACTNTPSIMITATPGVNSTISWWSAPSGGVMQGTGSPFETVGTGVMPTSGVAGVYTFYAQGDSAGCVSASRIASTVTLFDVIVDISAVNVTCNGANNGTFTLNSSTCGTAPFNWSVNGGPFGPIPTNLGPGSYTVVAQDAGTFTSPTMNITITEPSWVTSDPVSGTGINVCSGSPSAIISALGGPQTGPGTTFITDTLFLNFNVSASPLQGTTNPGTLFSSTTMPALPAGSTVTSASLTYNNVVANGASWRSEVRISLTGAINSPGIAGTGALGSPGTFNYIRPVAPGTVNIAGGLVNMGYWESFNDGLAPDATLPTGTPASTVMIIYDYPAPTSISWWDAPTAGTSQGTGSPFETVGTPLLPTATNGTYTFYAQGENGGCPSANRIPVTVSVSDVVAYLSPINIQCNGANDGSFMLDSTDCGTAGYSYAVDGGAFGPIPTNLAPGLHAVIVKDTTGGVSDTINITITEPSWMPDVPTVTPSNVDLCVGDPSAIFTIPGSGSVVIYFDVVASPIESPSPGTLFATATMPSLPAGAVVTSAQMTYANINSVGGSWNSEVRLGTSGAINELGIAGTGSVAAGGVFTYTRPVAPASINTAGGSVDLLYWESFDDLVVGDAIFPTGTAVASIVINYSVNGMVSPDSVNWYDAAVGGTLLATDDSLEAVGTSVLPNTNTPGTYTFYAEGFYHGCTSATRTAVTVNVGAYPVVNLGPDAAYCNNHVLDAGNPGLTYVWNDASTGQTLNALDTATYWVDVTSALGCTTRDSIDLVINPLPTVDLGPDTVSCGSYLLDPGPQPGTSTFVWNDLSTGSTLFTTTSGDFDVTVTDVNGCVNSDSVHVDVPPITTTNIGPDTTLCTNDTGFLLDATQPGANTYVWQDGSTGSSFFVNLPGTYWVTLTNFVGCSYTDTIVVTSVNPVQTNIDVNFITTSSATLDAGTGFTSYAWSTSASTQVITVTTNGTYIVTTADNNGCITTDTVTIVFSLGVFNTDGSTTVMQLYPNPSNGVFNLSIDNLETTNLVAEVLDLNGKVVYNRVIGSVAGSIIEPFSLTDLRMGTYVLRLTANGKASQLRFIINK